MYPKCSKWQIANVNVNRARSRVGNGTLCSKTMAPNGRWKTQLDIRWRPRQSASWFPLLTLRGWPLLMGEFAQSRVREQLFKHSADRVVVLCTCSLAGQQNEIKQKMGDSKRVLLKHFDELKKSETGTGTGQNQWPSPGSVYSTFFSKWKRQHNHQVRLKYFIYAEPMK